MSEYKKYYRFGEGIAENIESILKYNINTLIEGDERKVICH
jgi:hypothetical protein